MLAHVPTAGGPSIPGRRLFATSRRVAALTALAFGLTGAGILSAPPTALSWDDGAFSSASEQELIVRTNQSRANAGLKALDVDAELTAIARWRSKDMAIRGYFSHSIPPFGREVFEVIEHERYCFTLAGENIGWNTHTDDAATEQIHQAFLESPGHRANVMSERWNAIGVGAFKGADGKKVWTVLFADGCGPAATPREAPTSTPVAVPRAAGTAAPNLVESIVGDVTGQFFGS
jgi:uncharacterized protein YkwD